MNQITDGPNPTPQFGYDFDYAVWSANTRIDLVNVPFNNDYRDVVTPTFDIDKYIDSLGPAGITIDRMTYVRPNTPIRVNIPFNRATKYNYLRASNPAMPTFSSDIQKNYYYFILEARFLAPDVTELIVQLDVWQTYVRDVTFGNCYIERGHIGVANTNQMVNYGRDYLTVPEGFDTGSEYMVAWGGAFTSINVLNDNGANDNAGSMTYNILVYSTVDLMNPPGDVNDPNPPQAAWGTKFAGISSGTNVYIFKSDFDFTRFTKSLNQAPWITQGIISATMIPPISRYFDSITWQEMSVGSDTIEYLDVNELWSTGGNTQNAFLANAIKPISHKTYPNWRNDTKITDGWSERYRSLKKFFTSPYMMIEMTMWNGTPLILRPENWRSRDGDIAEIPHLVPPTQRIIAYPLGYNSNNDLADKGFVDQYSGDEWLDMITLAGNFPTMAITNNMSVAYMSMNAHQVSWQYSNADWSQQRAMGSANAQYDIASGAIATERNMANIGISADIAQTGNVNRTQAAQAVVGAISSPIIGAAGGAFTGTGAGVAVGAITGAAGGATQAIQAGIQIASNDEALAIRNNAARGRVGAQTQQMSLARDTNVDLSRWAARGDYSTQIAGINAKVQDSKMTQPSVSGQVGGEALLFAHPEWFTISLRWKTIDNSTRAQIGEYWLRYGYAIHRFIRPPQSLMVMDRFTYWKMTETYLQSAAIPESFKQSIRGILEKGVTVWANPNDIGLIDIAINRALAGVSY